MVYFPNSPPHITKSSKTYILFALQLTVDLWLPNLGQEHSNEFKKIEKLQEKAIKIIKFLPNDAPKTMKELKILKLKDFITLQNILFVKDSLTNEGITSFNKIFQQSTTTPYQNTRSGSSFQLIRLESVTETSKNNF